MKVKEDKIRLKGKPSKVSEAEGKLFALFLDAQSDEIASERRRKYQVIQNKVGIAEWKRLVAAHMAKFLLLCHLITFLHNYWTFT